MKNNKYEYLYIVQEWNAGYGWEDLTAGTWKEMRQNLKEYKENQRGIFRIIHRRELIKREEK